MFSLLSLYKRNELIYVQLISKQFDLVDHFVVPFDAYFGHFEAPKLCRVGMMYFAPGYRWFCRIEILLRWGLVASA